MTAMAQLSDLCMVLFMIAFDWLLIYLANNTTIGVVRWFLRFAAAALTICCMAAMSSILFPPRKASCPRPPSLFSPVLISKTHNTHNGTSHRHW